MSKTLKEAEKDMILATDDDVVHNFSRHDFNTDQRSWLELKNYPYTEPKSPFFTDVRDFMTRVNGKTFSLVAPSGLILEAIATTEADCDKPPLTATIISWVADEDARIRGRFAVTGVRVFEVAKGVVELIEAYDITPTVENNFNDGTEFPYGTSISPTGATI